jgi:HK97 family phage portal protein
MGIFDRLRRAFEPEKKYSTLDLWREIYGSRATVSGITVTIDAALQVSTVLACCRVNAEGVAQIPFRVYKQEGDRKVIASDHPVHDLISRRPNKWQTAFEFRETLMFHLMLTGNAFVFVNRLSNGKIFDLTPIQPGRVEVTQEADTRLRYKVKGDKGDIREFPAAAIWHLRGASWDSVIGMDAVKLARESIGLAMALEQSHTAMHKSGARTTGLLSLNEAIGPEAYASLAKWLEQYEMGGDRYQKPMILDRGATFTPMQQTGTDAQHLETRKYQVEEICRAFRVMPIMIGYSDKASTYASAEQMFLAHVTHTLMPWYERIEQSANVSLLTDAERGQGYYCKFSPNALLRGASADRAEFYTKALGSGGQKGWMTQNEVRELEELDKHPDPAADELPQPPAAPEPAQETPPDDTADDAAN